MLIELQVISYILQSGNGGTFIENNGISADWFKTYDEEIRYVKNHYNRYKKIPDSFTFMEKFEDFELLTVKETESYLVGELLNNYRFTLIAEKMQEIAMVAPENQELAHKELKKLVVELDSIEFRRHDSTNLFTEEFSELAKKEFIQAQENGGISGIKTGIEELDEILGGWRNGEELVVILGRLNEGKSWILIYFLVKSFMEGNNVLMYSGEMSKLAVFSRVVTFMENIGNMEITKGSEDVEDAYLAFLESTKNWENEFIVVEPKDMQNKQMSVDVLEQYVKKHNPDIIGLDQLSLMVDYRKTRGDTTRISHGNISNDLFQLSKEYEKPVLICVQASRKAMDDKGSKNMPPDMHHIAEADLIGQHASRVISIKQKDEMDLQIDEPNLLLKIGKNRYGKKNVFLGYDWDINLGKVERKTRINTSLEVDGDEVF